MGWFEWVVLVVVVLWFLESGHLSRKVSDAHKKLDAAMVDLHRIAQQVDSIQRYVVHMEAQQRQAKWDAEDDDDLQNLT